MRCKLQRMTSIGDNRHYHAKLTLFRARQKEKKVYKLWLIEKNKWKNQEWIQFISIYLDKQSKILYFNSLNQSILLKKRKKWLQFHMVNGQFYLVTLRRVNHIYKRKCIKLYCGNFWTIFDRITVHHVHFIISLPQFRFFSATSDSNQTLFFAHSLKEKPIWMIHVQYRKKCHQKFVYIKKIIFIFIFFFSL